MQKDIHPAVSAHYADMQKKGTETKIKKGADHLRSITEKARAALKEKREKARLEENEKENLPRKQPSK